MVRTDLGEYPALDSQLRSGRFSHAYIVSGPACGTKEALVAFLAQALVCSDAGNKPCGVCAHCRKALSGVHPDIIRVEREEGKRELTVDRIRAVRSDAFVLPNEAGRKVYIIEDAGDMNPAAQNALLKVLEEPPAYAVFLLATDNPGALLPTVRSRCVEIPYRPEGIAAKGEQDAKADELMELLRLGDRLGALRFFSGLDSMTREDLAEFAAALRRRAVSRLQVQGAPAAERERLIQILGVCDRVEKFADAYVSPVHIVGLMMAELL